MQGPAITVVKLTETFYASVLQNNNMFKNDKVTFTDESCVVFGKLNNTYMIGRGERLVNLHLFLDCPADFSYYHENLIVQTRFFKDNYLGSAKRYYKDNLPDPKEDFYSEEGIFEESLDSILLLEKVDNEKNFFDRLESENPQVGLELKNFTGLKSSDGVYRFKKLPRYTFWGQFEGNKQIGIGAVIFEDKFGVGFCKNFKINGQGRFFENGEIIEGIFSDNELVEKRKLNISKNQGFGELAKVRK